MTKRQWVGVVIALVVLVLLVLAVKNWDVADRANVTPGTPAPVKKQPDQVDSETGPSATYSDKVPENKTLTPAAVAVPAAPGAKTEKLRVFNMTVTKNGYDPSEIVVNQGDVVNINIKSVGGNYDMALPDIGLYHGIPDGETRVMAFQALVSGVFTFLCRDQCPVGGVIKGSLIVK